LTGVSVPDQVNDALWVKKKESKKSRDKKSEEKFFGKKIVKELPAEFVKYQQQVDAALEKAVAGTPFLKEFLSTRFSLSNGQLPHNMKF
jgi:large subunit ribosomal protein L6e